MTVTEISYKPFKSRMPTKRRKIVSKRCKRKSKPKLSKVGLKRLWGLSDTAYMRYTGLKGIYWHYFSKSIRKRDYQEYEGKCITCNEYVEPGQDQCGHFFAAKDCGFALLFHPLNNHLQHAKCNNPRFTPSAGIYNTINFLMRYGQEEFDKLLKLKKLSTQAWSKAEYEEKIRAIM